MMILVVVVAITKVRRQLEVLAQESDSKDCISASRASIPWTHAELLTAGK